MAVIFTIPRELNGSEIFSFTSTFWKSKGNDITFDFSNLAFSTPYPTLVLAAEIKSLIASSPENTYTATGIDANRNAHSYLGHIGFFQYVGINRGNKPGQASGSHTYIPISLITIQGIRSKLTSPDQPIGDAIQKEAERIAILLTRSNNLKTYKPIAYCLREIIRNVFEHANISQCTIFGQCYKDAVEIAIVDRGQGIKSSLSKRYQINSDDEAISLAIKPGISESDVLIGDSNKWANSGFGLFVLSELGRQTGSFNLCSGDAELETSISRPLIIRSHSFHGTAIRLRIQKPKGVNFVEYIEEIIKNGEEITNQSTTPRRASQSTRTI